MHPGACLCPQNVAPSPLWWRGFGGRVPGAVPWAGGFSPPFSPRAGGMGSVLWAPRFQPLPRHQLRWVLGLCHRRKCSSPSRLWAGSWVSRPGGAGGCARGPHNPILPRPQPPVQERGPGWCWPGWGGFAFACSIHTKHFAEEFVTAGVRLSQNAFHKRCQGRRGMAQGPQGVPRGPFLGAASPSQGNRGHGESCTCPPRLWHTSPGAPLVLGSTVGAGPLGCPGEMSPRVGAVFATALPPLTQLPPGTGWASCPCLRRAAGRYLRLHV